MKHEKAKSQRAWNGGDGYVLTPFRVADFALKNLSPRALAAFVALHRRFNGFNNGSIAFPLTALGEATGSKNRSADSSAIYEVIAFGLARIARQAHRTQGLAREYRLTFIESGTGDDRTPATNEWLSYQSTTEYKAWRGNVSNSRGSISELETPVSGKDIEPPWKQTGSISELETTETSGVSTRATGSISEQHISYQSYTSVDRFLGPPAKPSAFMELDELRAFVLDFLATAPTGSQSLLATAAEIQKGTLSKFLAGRGLPTEQAQRLHLATGRVRSSKIPKTAKAA